MKLTEIIRNYYVYILANKSNILYTGITNNLQRRIFEHKTGLIKGFTKKYKINKLIFFEEFKTAIEAISAEKRTKGWTRKKKINLIKSKNPKFKEIIL